MKEAAGSDIILHDSETEHIPDGTAETKEEPDHPSTERPQSTISRKPESQNSPPPPPPPTPPPNGGLQAWLQIAGCFFLWFNTWGLISGYGVFQSYYAVDALESHSQEAISWIGSVQGCLLLFGGAFSGPIYDMGYFRLLLITGAFLLVVGMMTTSVCHTYTEYMLAQGVCAGLGVACLWTPCVALPSQYFTSGLPIASGIAALGSGIGSVIFPIIIHALEPRIGLRLATRVLAFIQLGTLIVPVLLCHLRVKPTHRRSLTDLSAFLEPAYVLWVASAFVIFLGYYSPWIFIGLYAVDKGVADQTVAFYLLPIVATGSTIGRIVPNIIAWKIGMYNTWIICTLISGIFAFALIGTDSLDSIIITSCLYGFFSGAFSALAPPLGVPLSVHKPHLIGTRLGQCFAVLCIALLIGTPISAAIVDRYGYHAAFSYAGACALAGFMFQVAGRIVFAGTTVLKKV